MLDLCISPPYFICQDTPTYPHTHTRTPLHVYEMSLRWSPGGSDWVNLSAFSASVTQRVYKYCGKRGRAGGAGREAKKRTTVAGRAAGKAAGEGRDKTVKGSDMVW